LEPYTNLFLVARPGLHCIEKNSQDYSFINGPLVRIDNEPSLEGTTFFGSLLSLLFENHLRAQQIEQHNSNEDACAIW